MKRDPDTSGSVHPHYRCGLGMRGTEARRVNNTTNTRRSTNAGIMLDIMPALVQRLMFPGKDVPSCTVDYRAYTTVNELVLCE